MKNRIASHAGQQVLSRSAAANVSARAIGRPARPLYSLPVIQRNHNLENIEVGKNKWNPEKVTAIWAISESLNVDFEGKTIPVHPVHSLGVVQSPGKQELHMALTWIGVDDKVYTTDVLKNYTPKDEHTEIQAVWDIFNIAKGYYLAKEADPQQKMKGLIIEIKQTLSPCNSCATLLHDLCEGLTIQTIVRASSVKKHNSKIGAALNKYNPDEAGQKGNPDMSNIHGLHLANPKMEWG